MDHIRASAMSWRRFLYVPVFMAPAFFCVIPVNTLNTPVGPSLISAVVDFTADQAIAFLEISRYPEFGVFISVLNMRNPSISQIQEYEDGM